MEEFPTSLKFCNANKQLLKKFVTRPVAPIFKNEFPKSIDRSALSDCALKCHKFYLLFYELAKSLICSTSV